MTSRVCPKCKAPADAGDAFCRRCGAAIPKEPPKPVCPKCGREVAAGDRFCPGCGADLSGGGAGRKQRPKLAGNPLALGAVLDMDWLYGAGIAAYLLVIAAGVIYANTGGRFQRKREP